MRTVLFLLLLSGFAFADINNNAKSPEFTNGFGEPVFFDYEQTEDQASLGTCVLNPASNSITAETQQFFREFLRFS
jgi:hypothetical protein